LQIESTKSELTVICAVVRPTLSMVPIRPLKRITLPIGLAASVGDQEFKNARSRWISQPSNTQLRNACRKGTPPTVSVALADTVICC
jgi:hypothetical protein